MGHLFLSIVLDGISSIKSSKLVLVSHGVTPLKLRYQVTHGHIGALIGISGFPYFQLHLESPD